MDTLSYKLKSYKTLNKPIWNVIALKDTEMIASLSVVCDETNECTVSPTIGSRCQFSEKTLEQVASKMSEFMQFGSCSIKKPTGEIKVDKAISTTGEDLSACLMDELKDALKERVIT